MCGPYDGPFESKPKATCEGTHSCSEPSPEMHHCDGYTCSECGWDCPIGGPAGMDSEPGPAATLKATPIETAGLVVVAEVHDEVYMEGPPLVPAALPLAEVRATMRALRSYLGELYPTARELMTVGIDHIEAACDEMEGVPNA